MIDLISRIELNDNVKHFQMEILPFVRHLETVKFDK